MELKETLKVEMVAAMKAVGNLEGAEKEKAQVRLGTLRAALGSITEAETSGKTRRELDDAEVVKVLRKMVKQRAETAETYTAANELDRAKLELAEIEVIDEFLPELPVTLDEAATRELVTGIIVDKGLDSLKLMGQAMAPLKGRTDIDQKLAAKLVREILILRESL